MVLSWTDNTSTVRNANFQRLFAGPIPVTGGDGFTLELDDSGYKNAMQIDAIVLDATIIPEPATTGLLGSLLIPLALRRRR
jgi:hypothetical protein